MQSRLLKPIEESRGNDSNFAGDVFRDPYDSFMQKHLSYYGYFSGINDLYSKQYSLEWKHAKPQESDSSSDSSDEDNDAEPKSSVSYAYKDGHLVPKNKSSTVTGSSISALIPQEERAKWPLGMESVREKIMHIGESSYRNEPFYRQTGLESSPLVTSEERCKVVYLYKPIVGLYFARSMEGARDPSDSCTTPLSGPEDTTLIFESRFESGNLQKVVQVSEYEYQLYLRYDLYTEKHTQWYYFRVSNTREGQTYRFTIVNFLKSKSLYQSGMRPLIYSEREASTKSIGWHRTGSDIKYYRNNIKYKGQNSNKEDRYFYSLTFTCQFQHSKDTCYFAHCYPYTYTRLQGYLRKLSNDKDKSRICKQRELCRTLSGNVVYCLTISSPSQNPRQHEVKKAVVLTARVHPGESNSSWIMEGFLDYLTSNEPDAKLLRDTFIFKVVPMLNPDGVIVGNYRCSLAARDLNRNYKSNLRDSCPSVFYTRDMITRLIAENRNVVAYVDLHGHSRKHNMFVYGCENRHNPNLFLKERIIVQMMNQAAPDKLHIPSCKFHVQKYKEGTGRIVMWAQGIINSFTLEASLGGTTLANTRHFCEKDYKEIAVQFCDALLDYCDPDPTKYIKAFSDVQNRIRAQLRLALGRNRPEGSKPSTASDGNGGLDNTDNLSSLMADSLLMEEQDNSSDDDSDSSLSDGPPVNSRFIPKRSDDSKKRKKKTKTDQKKKSNFRQRAESEPAHRPEPVTAEPPKPRKSRAIIVSSSVTNSATVKPLVVLKYANARTPIFWAIPGSGITKNVIKVDSRQSDPLFIKLNRPPSKSQTSGQSKETQNQPSQLRFDSRSGAGYPIFTEERSVERMMKKGSVCYLEAVTDELLKRRMMMSRQVRSRQNATPGMQELEFNPENNEEYNNNSHQNTEPHQPKVTSLAKGSRPSTITLPTFMSKHGRINSSSNSALQSYNSLGSQYQTADAPEEIPADDIRNNLINSSSIIRNYSHSNFALPSASAATQLTAIALAEAALNSDIYPAIESSQVMFTSDVPPSTRSSLTATNSVPNFLIPSSRSVLNSDYLGLEISAKSVSKYYNNQRLPSPARRSSMYGLPNHAHRENIANETAPKLARNSLTIERIGHGLDFVASDTPASSPVGFQSGSYHPSSPTSSQRSLPFNIDIKRLASKRDHSIEASTRNSQQSRFGPPNAPMDTETESGQVHLAFVTPPSISPHSRTRADSVSSAVPTIKAPLSRRTGLAYAIVGEKVLPSNKIDSQSPNRKV